MDMLQLWLSDVTGPSEEEGEGVMDGVEEEVGFRDASAHKLPWLVSWRLGPARAISVERDLNSSQIP